jgi:hypothetical protein
MSYTLPNEMITPEAYNQRGIGKLPGHIGMVVTRTDRDRFEAYFDIREHHHAPNGQLGDAGGLALRLCDGGQHQGWRDRFHDD